MVSGIAQTDESYYISKTINSSFEEATEKVKLALKEQEFGVITEIEMHEKLAEKDFEIKPYRILGVCNPKFAYQTIQVEENIGLFLPCKVLVKYIDENTTEIVMVNPSSLMKMLGNEGLMKVADEVTVRFKNAMKTIK
ncbi:MAG: DUF302 domain-containing protein [Bacteroidetes bacterium]|nr:DUF302 domain-containing protein [Bacteroidota bacterium]